MLFVLPTTPALRSTSHLAPQQYEYPNQGYYYLHHNVPRFAVPSYSASQQRFFNQPSAEEIEEREYQQALAVISNHRRRQIEKEAATRRQQQVEAARQRYLASLAAELEQRRRQEEVLAARRDRILRIQEARARLAAAERQIALNEFLGQRKGGQPVTHQPHVAKLTPFPDNLKQRLSSVSKVDITRPTQNVLPPLGSCHAHLEKPRDFNEDSAKFVENYLSSLFPGLVFRTQPTTSTPTAQPKADDNGKGKARAVDPEESKESAQKPGLADVVGASGSSNSLPIGETTSPANPNVAETEPAQVHRATSLSSVEHIRNSLTKLQADFILPAELDHHAPSIDDHGETASVSSVSLSGLTGLIPYTSANKPVYQYEHELNTLLEKLDKIESHGDVGIRDRRKKVVKAVERALEGVERVVGETVEKRVSFVAPSTSVTEVQVVAPAAVDDAGVVEQSTPAQSEVIVAISLQESSPAEEPISESTTLVVSDDVTATLHVEPSPTEPGFGLSTSTTASESAELALAEPESTGHQIPAEEVETVDTFLLPDRASPPSPVKKPQLIDSDTDHEVLVLDDEDDEKSDWSEIEN